MEDDLESRLAVLCFLKLDFGGFYDSDGGKVSCWAVTFVPCTGQNYTVAVFFPGTVSKDADAGFRALSLLLDPALDPSGEDEKVSIFKRLFPDRTTLILSGDTGNGFRSYDMLWSDLSLQRSNV